MSDRMNTTLREKIAADVLAKLQAKNLPPEKAQAKLKSAKGWWFVAGAACLFALGVVALGFVLALKQEITVALTVFLGVMLVVPVGVALYAANTASGEATKAWLDTVGRVAKIIKKSRASDPPPA